MDSQGTHAILVKIRMLPNGVLDPNGAATGGVINEGYTVKGHYQNPPMRGQPFSIDRYERNGVNVPGVMTTSPVTNVTELAGGVIEFMTRNSVYHLIPLSL